MVKIYVHFDDFVRFWSAKKQSQTKPNLEKGKSKKAKGKMRVNLEFPRWVI